MCLTVRQFSPLRVGWCFAAGWGAVEWTNSSVIACHATTCDAASEPCLFCVSPPPPTLRPPASHPTNYSSVEWTVVWWIPTLTCPLWQKFYSNVPYFTDSDFSLSKCSFCVTSHFLLYLCLCVCLGSNFRPKSNMWFSFLTGVVYFSSISP